MHRKEARPTDARRHPRSKVSFPITLLLGENQLHLGFTQDISQGGVQAFVTQPLKVGDSIILRLDKVGDAPCVSLLASVRYHHRGGRYGIAFTCLSDEQRRVIEEVHCARPQRAASKAACNSAE